MLSGSEHWETIVSGWHGGFARRENGARRFRTVAPGDTRLDGDRDCSFAWHVTGRVCEIAGYRTWVDVATEGLSGAADVGRRQQPSLEAIRKLQPDVILTSRYRHASIADALGEIAPVHLIDDQESDGDMLASVYQSARQSGAALSRSDDAKGCSLVLTVRSKT